MNHSTDGATEAAGAPSRGEPPSGPCARELSLRKRMCARIRAVLRMAIYRRASNLRSMFQWHAFWSPRHKCHALERATVQLQSLRESEAVLGREIRRLDALCRALHEERRRARDDQCIGTPQQHEVTASHEG